MPYDFDALKSNTKLSDVISPHVKLRRSGREMIGLCPFHDEKSASFTVVDDKEFFHCFGCGAHGDVVDFVRHFHRLSTGDAVRLLGGEITSDRRPIKSESTPIDSPLPSAPISDAHDGFRAGDQIRAWNPKRNETVTYRPDAIWPYSSADGELLGYIFRIDMASGKIIMPLRFVSIDGESVWATVAFQSPRPLYGLDHLAPDGPVLIVEGEKSADAARKLLTSYSVVTWPGGTNAAHLADWTPLAGRACLVWPDADGPGRKAGHSVVHALRGVGATKIKYAPWDHRKPRQWDAADALSERMSPMDLLDWLQFRAFDATDGFTPPTPAEPIAPVHVEHSIFDPWETFAVPSFPIECLPAALARFVHFQSLSVGVDISALAMTALACCSGSIDHQFTLKLLRTGEWQASPRLWVMLVGDPSAKKTPGISACIRPAKGVERELEKVYRRHYAQWEEDKIEDKKAPKPSEPTRYIANDTTTEKLGEILSRQDRGILVEQDEISGWLGSMEKYGGGKGGAADRGFWLQAYNGGSKRVDRIGRGSIFIENLSISFVGGIQPKRLNEMGALSSDGLLQRFLPVMMRRAQMAQEIDDPVAIEQYKHLIHQLMSLRASQLFLSPEAMDVLREFRQFTHDVQQVDGLGDSFTSFVGKLDGVCGSLALILHLASNPEDGPLQKVSCQTGQAAVRIVREFIIPHAMALYRESTDKVDWEYLRAVASYILTSKNDRFTSSDFTAGVRALRGISVWDVSNKISPLVAGGWLIEEELSAPARAWKIVPGLRDRMAQRRETELNRKVEIVAMLKALQKREDDE